MKIFLLTILFICFISALKAQQMAEEDDSTFKEVKLNEIIISANRAPEKKNNIAQQTMLLSAGRMKFLNQQTTATLVEQTGNVFLQKSQLGGGSPVIRGFEANKILLVVDGVKMNNAIFRGGHLQNVITMDNAILEKMETLFGPSSVAYGSDALGGVISFYTKKPVLSSSGQTISSGNAFVRYSSAYTEKTVHGDLMTGGNKLASVTSFTFSDFGDLRQGKKHYSSYPIWGKRFYYVQRINGIDSMIANGNPDIQKQSGYKQYDFLEKLLLKASDKAEHILNFQYSTTSNIYRYDRLTETDVNGRLINAQWYYGPQKRLFITYQINLAKTLLYDTASIIAGYQDIEESRHNRGVGKINLNHRLENVKVYSLNADFNKQLSTHQLRYGAEVFANKVYSKAYAENIMNGALSSLDTRYPSGGSDTKSYALYTTHTKKISPLFMLTDGIRLTYSTLFSKFADKSFFPFPFNDISQHSTAITGNIGFIVSKEGWRIAPLFSTGFRTPNVDDLSKVFESAGGNLIVPNPNLKPEHTYNYELNLSKSFGNKIQIDVTGYYTQYKNALTTEPATFNGQSEIEYDGMISSISSTVNKASAYIYGVSGNIAADIMEHLSFVSTINYSHGRFKESPEDYPLDHLPPVFGKTSITVHFRKFTGEIFALYNSAKKSNDYNLRGEDNQLYSADPVNGYTPYWLTINFRSQYQLTQHVLIQLGVENIADKFYRQFASGLSSPGRNITLSLRTKF